MKLASSVCPVWEYSNPPSRLQRRERTTRRVANASARRRRVKSSPCGVHHRLLADCPWVGRLASCTEPAKRSHASLRDHAHARSIIILSCASSGTPSTEADVRQPAPQAPARQTRATLQTSSDPYFQSRLLPTHTSWTASMTRRLHSASTGRGTRGGAGHPIDRDPGCHLLV